MRLSAACLCFLHSPFPVALSVHSKCPWSRASSWIYWQSCFLQLRLQYGGVYEVQQPLVSTVLIQSHSRTH